MSEVNKLSERNAAIREMLADGEKLKNFYRFTAQNPQIDLYAACQIILARPNASVCFTMEEWNAMDRRITKGRKGIKYYDRDGNRRFVFDASDTHGENRYTRLIFPMKHLLLGLDELCGTDLINSKRRDYQKILSGVSVYLKSSERFSDDMETNMLTAEGVAYSLYCRTGFPKDNGIPIKGFPYSLQDNAGLFTSIKRLSDNLQEEIEDAYLRKVQEVAVIDDTEEETVSDEPVIEDKKEPVIVQFHSAIRSNYKGYDVFTNRADGQEKDIWLGRKENYDNLGRYDNTDNSLIHISENPHLWGLLSSDGYVVSQKKFVEDGTFTDDDYKEFNELKNGLLKDFEIECELKFDVDIHNPKGSGVPFIYPDHTASAMYIRYLSEQSKYPQAVVLYRLGDFYEVMGENAVAVSNELDLTLTGRDVGLKERVPMCGFPYHAAEVYIEKILEKHGVLVVENGQEPKYILSHAEALGQSVEDKPVGEQPEATDDEWTDEEINEIMSEETDEDEQPDKVGDTGTRFPIEDDYSDEDEPTEQEFLGEDYDDDGEAALNDKDWDDGAEDFETDESESDSTPKEGKSKGKPIRERKRKQKPQPSLFDFMDVDAVEEQTPVEKLKEWGLKYGSLIQSGKIRIYEKYQTNPTLPEFAAFLKEEYGWSGSYSGGEEIQSDGKGLAMAFRYKEHPENDIALTMKWTEVAEGIADLIDDDNYLTKAEQKEYSRVVRFRQERQNAKNDDELIDVIVNQIVEYGTAKAYSENFKEYPHFLEKYVDFWCEHEEPINERLLKRKEVVGINPSESTILQELSVKFKLEYCPHWQALLDRGAKRIERIHDYADGFIRECAEKYSADNVSGDTVVWSITQEDIGLTGYLFLKDNRDELTQYLQSIAGVKSANLTMDRIAVVFDKGFIDALAKGETSISATESAETTETDVNTDLTEVGFDQSELGGAKARFRGNIQAIRLVNKLYSENRTPTLDEKKILAKYVGWGGLSEAFDEHNEKWQTEYAELKAVLSVAEYKTAKGSVLNAHYTAKEVIEGIYKALTRFGVKGNNKILEPALGTGNFFGFMPKEIAENAKLYGVELDGITGKIASKLYPNANIQIKGFEQTTFSDNSFDLFVSNVPFGNYTVFDTNYARQNFHIHDYFIAKGIDKLRPNGLMAVITSKGTMDKLSPTVRKYIADRSELLGAMRLPNTAFKQTANTEVTSDILFFRKREEKINAATDNTEWLGVGKNEDGFELNNYYVLHPEMLLGTLAIERGLYGFEDLTLKSDGEEISVKIGRAIENLPRDIYDNPTERQEEERATIEADYNVRPLCYKAERGKLYMRIGDEMVEQTIPQSPKDAYARMVGMITLRRELRHILEMQTDGCTDEQLLSEQRQLNANYDSFVRKYGFLNSQTNSKLFQGDGDSSLVFAAEELSEDKKTATKADVFTKRTIRPYTAVTSTDDCFEALQISKNEKGWADIAYIEELTKKDYETVLSELGNAIYRNPLRVDPNDKYTGFETSEEYLSGRVAEKLRAAKRYAEGEKTYERNVKALEEVQPTPLTASEISARIGASWIDKEYYAQFLCEILDIPRYMRDGIEVNFNKHDGSWRVDRESYARGYRSLEVTQVYGTNRANAYRLFEDCLNQKSTQIYDTVEDSDGHEKRVLNQAETIAAREKQNKIKETFKNWIFQDPDRRYDLEETYNEIFNQVRLPVYDGSYLRFPQMNPAIELRPHQKNAVHRIVSTGNNTLLHHVVGSGKTITMIASGMKLRQYGLAKKPMYVVPNHLLQQWGAEFRRLYPSANILIAQKEDLEKEKRRQFVSKVAMGDWDGIIIAQSSFAKISISPERQIEKIREEISSIEESILSQKNDRGSAHGSVKNLERIKKNRETQLKKLLDDDKKDNVLIFEKLGVDYLFVDEADAYKNLFLFTKMNNVAGISSAASQRASDLQLKIEYISELRGGDKGVVFATGTPISNSMTEMYTMQTYLQKGTLQRLGITYFDLWAADFGEAVTSLELAPSGQGYRAKTRFAKFTNLPELLTLYRSFADVQTSDMVKLDVPDAERKVITIKPSDTVIQLTEEIAERAERIYGGGVNPHEDNMLKVTSDGKKLALDARCFDALSEDNAQSKIGECANNVFEIYKDSDGIKGTQLVFCDLSTPKKAFDDYEYGKDFDAYNDLKHKLVQKGIPKEEIAFIHDAATDLQKQALFNNVNSGKIRVLIGSTEKCGAGTNVQKRLTAIHHLDAPYRPRDLIQRNGRGIRQGNMNKNIQIFTYVTERTFDSYSYQILENKQRFISQIDRGDLTVREAEDIDETTLSYAEIKAITSANPKIKRKMELDNELLQMRILEGQYKKNLYDLQDKIRKEYPEQIQRQTLYLERLRKDIRATKEKFNPEVFSIDVNGKTYTDKKEGGQALLDALYGSRCDTVVAKYCGFKISLDPLVLLTNERTVTLSGAGSYSVYISQSAYGTLTRLDNFLKELPDREHYAETKLENTQKDLSRAEEEIKAPFEYSDRILKLNRELSEINAELDLNKREEVVIDDGNDGEGDSYTALPKDKENSILDENDKIAALAVDFLPDYTVTQDAMHGYGYFWDGMLPLRKNAAERLYELGLDIKRLNEDDSEGAVDSIEDLREHEGLFGIEKPDWLAFLKENTAVEYFTARYMAVKSAQVVVNSELSYADGMYADSISDDLLAEKEGIEVYLANKKKPSDDAMKPYLPPLFDEFTDKISGIPLEAYGWTEYDVRTSLAENLQSENLREYGKELVAEKRFSEFVNDGLKRIKWLDGRTDGFTENEIGDIISALKPKFENSSWDKSGYDYQNYDDWYDNFSEEQVRPYLISICNENKKDGEQTQGDSFINTWAANEIRPNYKELIISDIDSEFEKFKSGLLEKSSEDIFYDNFEIHVKTELRETMKEEYLENKYYRALYEERGHILETMFNDFISEDYASVDNYEKSAEYIRDYCNHFYPEIIQEEERREREERSHYWGRDASGAAYYYFEETLNSDMLSTIKEPADSYVIAAPYTHLSDDETEEKNITFLEVDKNIPKEELTSENAFENMKKAAEKVNLYEKSAIPVYYRDAKYAHDHGETAMLFDSCKITGECVNDITAAINKNYKDNILGKGFENKLIDRYGLERITMIVAKIIRDANWDLRYSDKNKKWAKTIPITESVIELQRIHTNAHPGLADLFATRIREKMKESVKSDDLYLTETHQGYKILETTKDNLGRNVVIAQREKNYAVGAGYNAQDGTWAQGYYDFATLESAKEFVKEKYGADNASEETNKAVELPREEKTMPDKQDTNGKTKWLHAYIPYEAVIKKYDKYSFMRMPERGDYIGYTYNMYNNRLKESVRMTDLQSESRERCLDLVIGETQEIVVRKGDDEIVLTGQEFVDAVTDTYSEDYEKERDETEWVSVKVPQDAVRGMYGKSTLLSMPNGEYSGYSYYLPSSMITEDSRTDDGSMEIILPADFKVNIKNRSTDDEKTLTPEELYKACNGKTSADYALPKNREENAKYSKKDNEDSGWHNIAIPAEAKLTEYDKASLFKTPNGKYGDCFYYLPNTLLSEKDGNVVIKLPDDFSITVKDKARDFEETLTASEFVESIRDKTAADYTDDDNSKAVSEDKFKETEKRLRDNVPDEMKNRPNWCIVRTRQNENGRLEKYIIDCHTGKFAESDNPKTWTDFDTACQYARENGGIALAYALDGTDKVCCIDIDHCVDEKGNDSPLMTSMVQKSGGTYRECSLSGKGYHFFGKTNGLNVRTFSRDGDLEFYQKSHFIAMTGDTAYQSELKFLDNLPVMELIRSKCDKRAEWKGERKGIEGLSVMSDREVVEKAESAKHGDTFKALFDGKDVLNNHSNSDMSLMSRLAYWCNGDKEQMLRIFAVSRLFRPEKSPDYYEGTAIKALEGNVGRFTPQAQTSPKKTLTNVSGNSR